MSQKRPFSTALSPSASTPSGTPAAALSPSLSPVASTSNLTLGPAPKKRRIGRPKKNKEGTAGDGGAGQVGGANVTGQGGSGEGVGAGQGGVGEEDDDDDDDEEEVKKGRLADDDYTVRKREDQANKEKLRVLLDHFDPQQLERYSEYRSSGLNKTNVRRLANAVLQQSVSERVVIAVRGFAKVFVGDIVERALEVQARRGGSGPLTTYDMKQAYRAHLLEKDRGGSDRRAMFIR